MEKPSPWQIVTIQFRCKYHSKLQITKMVSTMRVIEDAILTMSQHWMAFSQLSSNMMLWLQINSTETHLPTQVPKSRHGGIHLDCQETFDWTFRIINNCYCYSATLSRQGRKNRKISNVSIMKIQIARKMLIAHAHLPPWSNRQSFIGLPRLLIVTVLVWCQ